MIGHDSLELFFFFPPLVFADVRPRAIHLDQSQLLFHNKHIPYSSLIYCITEIEAKGRKKQRKEGIKTQSSHTQLCP